MCTTRNIFFACVVTLGASSAGFAAPQDFDNQAAVQQPAPQNIDLYAPSGSPALNKNLTTSDRGMEVVTVGGLNILVPKGMRVRKEGSQIVFEDIGEYLGRRLQFLEDRVDALEKAQQDRALELQRMERTIMESGPVWKNEEQKTNDDGG